MGIQNLLRFMKPFCERIHIQKYSGKRVGIDAYSWLHKGAYSCNMDICLNPGSEASNRYIQYFMHRINLLRHHKITPVVVFDGGNLPCKSTTQEERQRRRDNNLALAKEKLHQGNVSGAIEFFQRAVSITPSMAHQLIQLLRSENVEFIVAPYEADAQLAYLSTLEEDKGGIAAVITEDSDLMAYGCQAIIFKMDRYGIGEEIVLEKVFNSGSKELSFKHLDEELFTGMCILAGCDFLPSVPGIGIKRAYSLVSKYRNLDRVLSVIKYEKGHQIPEEYLKSFKEAFAVFNHARIYDAETKALKPMKPLSQKLLQSFGGDLDFLGPEIPPSVAAAIAEGRLDPITMEAFDQFPKAGFLFDPVCNEDFADLNRANCNVISEQQSCLTIFSSHEYRVEKVAAMEQTLTIDNKKCLNEAIALEKLIAVPKLNQNLEVIDVERTEYPDNNPFKKRKLEYDNSNLTESMTEEVSVVTDVTRSDDILYATPESQESVESKPSQRVKLVSNTTQELQESVESMHPQRKKLVSNKAPGLEETNESKHTQAKKLVRNKTVQFQESVTHEHTQKLKLVSNATPDSQEIMESKNTQSVKLASNSTPKLQERFESKHAQRVKSVSKVKKKKLKSTTNCSPERQETGIFRSSSKKLKSSTRKRIGPVASLNLQPPLTCIGTIVLIFFKAEPPSWQQTPAHLVDGILA